MFIVNEIFLRVSKSSLGYLKLTFLNSIIKLSIFIWTIVGCIEGAFWLPPTALNIFLILALGLVDQKVMDTSKGE